jgi:hypothetical protein
MIGLGIGMDSYRTTSADAQAIRSAYLAFRTRVLADSGTIQQPTGFQDELRRLSSVGVFDDATLIVGGAAGKVSKLYELYGNDFTVSRAGTKWVLGADGLLTEVPANVPAFEWNADGTYRGVSVEPGATNLALHSRDLTQAAWVKTNATPARTATGADGTANTGTTLTATAGNATILQAITSASSARVFGARVRRRTGTGTVEITQDNGTTWTAITLTSTYQLFPTASQTLTNPTVGFRIVTSGDAIDVDFCQAETGAVSTSPIVTAGSTANRVADSVTLTGASSLIGQTEGTIYCEAYIPVVLTGRRVFGISDGTATNRLGVTITSGGNLNVILNGTIALITGPVVTTGIYKLCIVYTASKVAYFINGVKIGEVATSGSGAYTDVDLGQTELSAAQLIGNIASYVGYTSDITDAQAIALTTS